MTLALPPLDLHAHIKPTIPARDLERLGAVVFAATRSLTEFASTQRRRDAVTIWGVGCHPGVLTAQNEFTPERFASLLRTAAFVSEVGLDHRSKVPMATQEATFRAILTELTVSPRIVSIHSSGACADVLDLLEKTPIQGAVLHWWRGTPAQTARAVALGCWFSVNAAGMKHAADVALIPSDRLLTETDHPSGNYSSPAPRQPGAVLDVESELAKLHKVSPSKMRLRMWRTLNDLVSATEVAPLLPSPVKRMLSTL
ncbi:TatD family hydrolase [Clavibacter michiganensis subsp. phaseoli]|uniref:TatD family hydrolase n=1 Tax=Clavibacter phaseoli TaxID=1734031 RepID=UPI001FB3349B|nr:TatD family hydrolase [Clavibacter phaseoli]MCJ1712507.1 TatD family hydrolase [Clavibacter phaseoli]